MFGINEWTRHRMGNSIQMSQKEAHNSHFQLIELKVAFYSKIKKRRTNRAENWINIWRWSNNLIQYIRYIKCCQSNWTVPAGSFKFSMNTNKTTYLNVNYSCTFDWHIHFRISDFPKNVTELFDWLSWIFTPLRPQNGPISQLAEWA